MKNDPLKAVIAQQVQNALLSEFLNDGTVFLTKISELEMQLKVLPVENVPPRFFAVRVSELNTDATP